MFRVHKRRIRPLTSPEERDRKHFLDLQALPDKSPVELEHQHVFAAEHNRKRSYADFQRDEHVRRQLALQLEQPYVRIHPTGETWSPPRALDDPDSRMTDAPPARHVHYTPPLDWKPSAARASPQVPLQGILKQRMTPYHHLPSDFDRQDSPFEWDLSEYCDEREKLDEQIVEQQAERERQEKRQEIREREAHLSTRKARQDLKHSRVLPPPRPFPRAGGSLLCKSPPRPVERKLDLLAIPKKEPPEGAPNRLRAVLQTTKISPLARRVLTSNPSVLPYPGLALPSQDSSPPARKILTPIRRRVSPPQRGSPLRPSAVGLYPQLVNNAPPNPPIAPEPAIGRRIGGFFIGALACIPRLFQLGYTVLHNRLRRHQEIYAVEVTPNGRKRRAVAAGDIEPITPARLKDFKVQDVEMEDASLDIIMPGYYPASEPKQKQSVLKQEHTPPASRPGSSSSNNVDMQTQGNLIQQSMNEKAPATVPSPNQQKLSAIPAQSTDDQQSTNVEASSTEQSSEQQQQPMELQDLPPPQTENSAAANSKTTTMSSGKASKSQSKQPEGPPAPLPLVHGRPRPREELYTCTWTRTRHALHMTPEELAFEAKLDEIRVAKGLKVKKTETDKSTTLLKTGALPPDARPAAADRKKVNEKRDAGMESMLARTQHVKLELEELSKSLRETLLRDKQIVSEEHEIVPDLPPKPEADFQEQARLAVEKETVELRAKAVKEAEEERARLAAEAEEKRARLAAETAKADAEWAEKQKLIRDLPSEWAAKMHTALHVPNQYKVLAKAADGADITAYDLSKVMPEDAPKSNANKNWWLNDATVNAVMNAIVAAKKEQTGYKKTSDSAPEIVAFNSGWYTNYQNKRIGSIKTWSRRLGVEGKKLLTAKKIFFPVNTGSHWTLLVLGPRERRIEVLDSAGRGSKTLFRVAREWLEMELQSDYIAEEWTEVLGRSQQQLNADDCGVFTCMNALAAAKDRDPSEVTPTLGMKNARRMIVAVLLNGGFKGDWEL